MTRAVFLLGLVLAGAACFAPKVDSCALRCQGGSCPGDLECKSDGFCHKAGDTQSCTGGGLVDAPPGADGAFVIVDARVLVFDSPVIVVEDAPLPLFDARTIDARPPIDGSNLPADARIDAAPGIIDARPPVDAAGVPDARNCATICSGERTCGFLDGCQCGIPCTSGSWCTDFCDFAVCEINNCCLPEGSPCELGAGQCCQGLTCLIAVCGVL